MQDEVEMRNQFLPFNYMQSLYKQLHNLKQHGSAEEYTEAFYQPVARVDLNESEEQMVARFLSGLKPPIQDALSMHQLWSVSKAYNRVLIFKKQLARKAFVQFQAYGGSKSTQVSTQGRPTTTSAQPFKIDSAGLPSTSGTVKPVPKAAQRFTFKCYKCGEARHKATNCKKGGVNRGQ